MWLSAALVVSKQCVAAWLPFQIGLGRVLAYLSKYACHCYRLLLMPAGNVRAASRCIQLLAKKEDFTTKCSRRTA